LSINNKPGNCLRFVCDGLGNEIIQLDNTNVRRDGDFCTEDLCVEGTPVNKLGKAGVQCGTNANVQCTETGVCQGCTVNTDCGTDSECTTWTCENSICIKNLQPIGKEIANAVKGDCKKNLCNAIGESPDTFAADDAPSDEDPCTADYCASNGEILHDIVAEGTSCGDCLACSADGLCKPCDLATSACSMGACVPKPQKCAANSECASAYCVDGYCCNTECSSQCMACDEATTGVLSGICAPIKDGTDPYAECNGKVDDVCRNSSCGCENGIKDGTENGVDCGGDCPACTGTWNCGGLSTCGGIGANQDCCYFCSCPNESQNCKMVEGQTCALGVADIVFRVGTISSSDCFGFPECRSVTCKCQ
jgi:hypothetical protein